MRTKRWLCLMSLILLAASASGLEKESPPRQIRLRDVATVEGVRDN